MKYKNIRYATIVFSTMVLIGCGGGGNSNNPSSNNSNQTGNNIPQAPNSGNQRPNDASNLPSGFQEFREILAGTDGVTAEFLEDLNSAQANTLRTTFQDTQLFFEKVENQSDPSGFSGSFQNSEKWTFCADGRFEVVFSNTTSTSFGGPVTDRQQFQGVWDASFTGEPTKRNAILAHSSAPEVLAINPTGLIPLVIDSVSADTVSVFDNTVRSGRKLYRRTAISCN